MASCKQLRSLPTDVLERILSYLDLDSLRAAELVCTLWRHTVKEGDLWLEQPSIQSQPLLAQSCGNLCIDRLERAEDQGHKGYRLPPPFPASGEPVPKGLENALPRRILRPADLRIYAQKRLVALLSDETSEWPSTSLVRNVLGASSTDHVEESALNLLIPEERVTFGMGVSYWSSKGSRSPDSIDWVAFRLAHPLCLLREVRLRPFKAWFQPGAPIYAPVAVRFRVGGAMLFDPVSWQLGPAWLPPASAEEATDSGWDAAGWTWTSPAFPVQQGVAGDQVFELPKPILCLGGLLVIELLGKTQQQAQDSLFYVCLSYVHVKGRPVTGFALDPGREPPSLDLLESDPLAAQGGLALIGRRLQSAVGLWHAQAGIGGWIVPGEGLNG